MNRAHHRALLLAVVLLVGACAPVGKMSHDMDKAIRSASTKADYEALAAHYEEEAKALQAKAVEHQSLIKVYEQLSRADATPKPSADMAHHCATLASTYRQAAAENLAIAKEHRALAAAASK